MSKVKSAEDFGDRRDDRKKKKKREVLSQMAVSQIESRLRNAIRSEYRAHMLRTQPKTGRPASAHSDRNGSEENLAVVEDAAATAVAHEEKKLAISTRALLPYYTLDSVHQFLDIFAKVDENFSGDLDVYEWIRLFTSLNESIPVQEARMVRF